MKGDEIIPVNIVTKKTSLSDSWDRVCYKMQKEHYYISPILGKYKQWEFLRLLDSWIPEHLMLALKTDSFEEAFGADRILNYLAQKSREAIGLDISLKIINEAKKQISDNKLRWTATDISYMPFKDDTFDLIFSSSTYGYLDNVREGLKQAYRILKPDGLLVISINNRCNLMSQVVRRFFCYLKESPFPFGKAYTLNSFKVILKEVGFRVHAYEPAVHIFPLLNSLLPFLKKKNTRLFKIIYEMILKSLKKYSIKRNLIKYLTGWYIVFNVRKPAKNNDERLEN